MLWKQKNCWIFFGRDLCVSLVMFKSISSFPFFTVREFHSTLSGQIPASNSFRRKGQKSNFLFNRITFLKDSSTTFFPSEKLFSFCQFFSFSFSEQTANVKSRHSDWTTINSAREITVSREESCGKTNGFVWKMEMQTLCAISWCPDGNFLLIFKNHEFVYPKQGFHWIWL